MSKRSNYFYFCAEVTVFSIFTLLQCCPWRRLDMSRRNIWHEKLPFSIIISFLCLLSTFFYIITQVILAFWLVESSTINLKLYSVRVPIKFLWKRRNFVEGTINKKSHDLLVQFVNNRHSWFWKFSNCTRLKARAILRTFKITRTY